MASSSQPAVAPQATETTEASPATNTQDTTPPSSPPLPARSIARPAGGNATSNTANTTAADANVSPAPTQTPTIAPGAPTPGPTATPAAAPPDESLSLNDKLNAGDRYWKFKFGFMAVLVITGLIGIGCFGWLITSNPDKRSAGYGYGSFWNLWPCMLTWSVSIAWCAICAIIFIVRKRTVHPGVRVSMELLLWMAFIITALCALLALQGLNDFGMYGGPDQWNYDYSSSAGGDYVLASNNTWVWEPNTDGISTPRDCSRGLNTYGDLEFKDCADQDAFINKLWAAKPHRMTVTLTGIVCQFFSLALHFALFVWACVDTHHYRRTKVNKDAEKIAAGIVQTMISNGAIIPPPGQARMNPAPVQGMYYSQVPPQVYSPQTMYMQSAPGQHPQHMGQQQYMVPAQYPMRQQGAVGPAPGVAGPSNEKAGGLRYA